MEAIASEGKCAVREGGGWCGPHGTSLLPLQSLGWVLRTSWCPGVAATGGNELEEPREGRATRNNPATSWRGPHPPGQMVTPTRSRAPNHKTTITTPATTPAPP